MQQLVTLSVMREHMDEREVVGACCLGCGETKQLKLCSRCRVARFCGPTCARGMWPRHKKGCKLFVAAQAGRSDDESDEA
mmetsp:Transcript_21873/g.67863  ORF Transcript_21873/g.67863 Transcript_21873/m.67863 type:complete len:80 (+) Transcript_21873:615-854(+)